MESTRKCWRCGEVIVNDPHCDPVPSDPWRARHPEWEECVHATRARVAEVEAERDEAREIIGEYLNPICAAFERVQKIERHPPGSGISDPDYPGPTNDEIEQYDDELMSARNDLTEAIQVACDAQEGE